MKILSVDQIHQLDQYTIKNEPIASIDLMERAASAFTNWFIERYYKKNRSIHIYCGPGNNGGDGLAVARMLYQKSYDVQVFICQIGKGVSDDFKVNYERLEAISTLSITKIKKDSPFPSVMNQPLLIDAIFGSGLNRPVEGYWAALLEHLNNNYAPIISIDIPSGVFANRPTTGASIRAHATLSFELPKLAFLYPENALRIGHWETKPIGLHPHFIHDAPTNYFFVSASIIQTIRKRRSKYAHKGTHGHALMVVGSYGKIGAGILAAKACLRAGAGLVSALIPACGYAIFQTALPEVMVYTDPNHQQLTMSLKEEPDKFDTLGIGCGIGTSEKTKDAFKAMLQQRKNPIVLDADALNIIAQHPDLWEIVPPDSILTPHSGEFKRLFGNQTNDFERNEVQIAKSREHQVFIILKGAHTAIATPKGTCYFNSSGNPGMASAGSGDVLTGILTGLLAQGYSPLDTAILGVYLHGLAGDLAIQDIQSEESLIASDLINYLGQAFNAIAEVIG